MENLHRALNISFIDEWNKFSLINKLNLKKSSIQLKLENSFKYNEPGIGVGGYCLTKDPKFAEISQKKYLKQNLIFHYLRCLFHK